jgi:saccharopine dehydrogenase-like NADP-dependent oxidoreductase
MNNKEVTILGGFGSVGIEVAQYLLEHSDVNIILAARKLRPISEKLKAKYNERIKTTILDATNSEMMNRCCQSSDLVISCIGPSGMLGDLVPQSCKANSTPLVDASGYDPVLESLEGSEKYSPTKVPIIINVGLLPGISGMFPNHVMNTTKQTANITQLDVQYVGRDAWTYNSAWDIINGLGDFGQERGFCYLDNNKLIKVPITKANNKCHFPDPIGSVSTMLLYAEEMNRLAKQHSIPKTRVFGANIGPRATFICMIAKIFRMYRNHKLIDRAARWLVSSSARDMRKLKPAYGVQVDIKYEDETHITGHIMLENTYQATGVIIGITARAVLEGLVKSPGIFMLHEALDDNWFMQQLKNTGLITFLGMSDGESQRVIGVAQ